MVLEYTMVYTRRSLFGNPGLTRNRGFDLEINP